MEMIRCVACDPRPLLCLEDSLAPSQCAHEPTTKAVVEACRHFQQSMLCALVLTTVKYIPLAFSCGLTETL